MTTTTLPSAAITLSTPRDDAPLVEQGPRIDQRRAATQGSSVGAGTDSPQAIDPAAPMPGTPEGADLPASQDFLDTQVGGASGDLSSDNGHDDLDAQQADAVVAPTSTTPAIAVAAPIEASPGVVDPQTGSAERGQSPGDAQRQPAALADPTLALLADVLDDLERTRIANENRLRQLTRTEEDSDGEERGFGYTTDHPDVKRLADVVEGIATLEHQATLNLARIMRAHPLGPWVKAQKGIGEKQAARLLASIGDPYIRPAMAYEDGTVEPERPRTVSELWAYCGLHTLPTGQSARATHSTTASGDQSGDPGHHPIDAHRSVVWVAARRQKGQKSNWSSNAKMRAWNIAGSMLKAGNRELYDRRKAASEGRVHAAECVRCGPSGKPAQPGSPWSDAHRHADALRIVSKELLKQLWRESRRIHENDPDGGSPPGER